MGAHLICEDLLAIGDVFDSTPQEVADWAAANSVELAQGLRLRASQEFAGGRQQVSPRKEGAPLNTFDEEQPQPQGGPPPMPQAGASSGSVGKLSTALQRLLPTRSSGSEGSHQSSTQQERKKRARAKGNVVVVQAMRSSSGQAGETPVLVRTCCRSDAFAVLSVDAAVPSSLRQCRLKRLLLQKIRNSVGRALYLQVLWRLLSPDNLHCLPSYAEQVAPQEVSDVYDQDERLLRSFIRLNTPTSAAASYSSR
jgi:hypothetical protein